MGYTFEDYDRATRMTARFIRDATREQVLAQANLALAADQQLTQGTVLERLFSNVPEANEHNHTAYSAYNGDALEPPAYLGKSFGTPHNHYMVSNSATIDSGDLEATAKAVTEHGFGVEPGSQLVAIVNPEQMDVISTFRAGQENATGIVAKHDFIPSAGAPPYFTPQEIVGQIAPETFNGLKVQGSYGPLWLVSSDFVPEDYISVFATYGANHPNNAIGFREHPNAVYQGLRSIPGVRPGYPLIESFFSRAFGVGFRRRGQAAVMQIKASGSYEVPDIAK